jgi:hypothetical protein
VRTGLPVSENLTRSADDLNAVTAGPPRFEVWMRTPSVDSELAPALAAYATDLLTEDGTLVASR